MCLMSRWTLFAPSPQAQSSPISPCRGINFTVLHSYLSRLSFSCHLLLWFAETGVVQGFDSDPFLAEEADPAKCRALVGMGIPLPCAGMVLCCPRMMLLAGGRIFWRRREEGKGGLSGVIAMPWWSVLKWDNHVERVRVCVLLQSMFSPPSRHPLIRKCCFVYHGCCAVLCCRWRVCVCARRRAVCGRSGH